LHISSVLYTAVSGNEYTSVDLPVDWLLLATFWQSSVCLIYHGRLTWLVVNWQTDRSF